MLGLALGILLAGCAEEPIPVPPMPPDLRVVPPPTSVPRENAKFSGRWVGKWDDALDHILVVELEIQNDPATEVIAVYSWGGSGRSGSAYRAGRASAAASRTARCGSSFRGSRPP